MIWLLLLRIAWIVWAATATTSVRVVVATVVGTTLVRIGTTLVGLLLLLLRVGTSVRGLLRLGATGLGLLRLLVGLLLLGLLLAEEDTLLGGHRNAGLEVTAQV